MKKVIVGCLVMAMMFMVGCNVTTLTQDLNNIGKRFPNSEIFRLSDNTTYLVRTSSNEVFFVSMFYNGTIDAAKVFNARPEFVSPESPVK
jgi:hypothetical protein